jgi:hypothetical protein
VTASEQHFPYIIKKATEDIQGQKVKLWRCQCKLYFKSGLPCWHEIKTCLSEGADLTRQVNPYWLAQSKVRVERPVQPPPVTEHDVKDWPEHDSFKHTEYPNDADFGALNTKIPPKIDYFNYELNDNEPKLR